MPERRKHTRVSESIACELGWASRRVTTKAVNLSCGGVLCALPEPIPPMTKLEVNLELPSLRWVRCVGVVVRQDPITFQTAIYFSEIHPEDRRRLGEFILQSMLRC